MYEKRGNKEGFDEYYLLQANQQLNNQSCLAEYSSNLWCVCRVIFKAIKKAILSTHMAKWHFPIGFMTAVNTEAIILNATFVGHGGYNSSDQVDFSLKQTAECCLQP